MYESQSQRSSFGQAVQLKAEMKDLSQTFLETYRVMSRVLNTK